MRIGLRSSMIALTTTVGLGAAAESATAATLYTTAAHTTEVAVGTTAGMTNTTPVVLMSATSPLNTCNSSTLSMTVGHNSGGTVTATISSGSFSACAPLALIGTFGTPWRLTISGLPTTSGSTTTWAATVTGVSVLLGGGTYAGNLNSVGVSAHQTGFSGAVCLNFSDAGTLVGPLTTNMRVSINYCFEGSAATYSLF
jgi:hypothetical protein